MVEKKPKPKTKKQLDATQKHSHKERVAMRELVRSSGMVNRQADNEEVDRWLYSHGYLYAAGYKPPKDRVKRLAKNLGVKEPKIAADYRGKR